MRPRTGRDLTDVRSALEAARWQEALDRLDAIGETHGGSAELLELRGHAAYGAGRFDLAVSSFEQRHLLLLEDGDELGAADAAATVALYLLIDAGLMAPVRGWLRRAERLLEGHDETPTHAMIAMIRGYERFFCGDLDAARTWSARALELGERHGVQPAVVVGRTAAARIDILEGRVEDGLDQLDEIAAALMSGSVDPLTAGMMYCELICAVQGLALHDRAREWTDAMDRWRQGAAFGGLSGRCRVHRAELLRLSGPGERAEQEALAACEELRPWMRREFGWPLVELGTIRLRRGDLDGAEEAFLAAHHHAWSPQPGLALVRLAQGDVRTAMVQIADAIAHPFNYPSKERPPFGDLRLAPLLEAQAEIATVAEDPAVARRAADALGAIAAAYPSAWIGASAALADARASMCEGEAAAAIEPASVAVAAWMDLGAPFETARARLVLGDALHAIGRHDAACMEWWAAAEALQAFGAGPWSQEPLSRLREAGASPDTVPEMTATTADAVFCCAGGTRTIRFGDRVTVMRDLKGLRYIERLVAEPDRELHALELVAAERGAEPATRLPDGDVNWSSTPSTNGLPVLDEVALAAYRRRLAEVEADVEEARAMNDLGRLEAAESDRDYLVAELARAVGLGGRRRTTGGDAERARTSVTRSIRYALGRVAEHDPVVASHLQRSIRTGVFCSYVSDRSVPVAWRTEADPSAVSLPHRDV